VNCKCFCNLLCTKKRGRFAAVESLAAGQRPLVTVFHERLGGVVAHGDDSFIWPGVRGGPDS
jgi:hypothetical protein